MEGPDRDRASGRPVPSEPRGSADPPPEVPRSQLWLWRIWATIGGAVILAGLWWALREPLAIIVPPLALAAVLVYILNPVVGWLKDRRVPRGLGAATAYLVLIAGVVIFVQALGPTIVRQTGDLLEQLPEISANLQKFINTQLERLNITSRVTIDLESRSTQLAIQDYIGENRDNLLGLLGGAVSVVGRLLHGLLTLILAPILAFYILADLPRLVDGIERLVPPGTRSEVVDVGRRIGRTVGNYFRGQLLVATFVGLATATGLALIGLPFWALIGATAGIFNLIPLVGPFLGGVIGVLVALTVGDGGSQALWVVVVMTAVQQIDNHVITPNIVARTVKVHPLTVILSLLVAGSLYGLLGMFVAIPIVATVKLVLMYLLVTRVPAMDHLAGEGPGLFGDEDDLPEPAEGTLTAMGRELRRTWERRRGAEAAAREAARARRSR